ncbi:MAG: hypothetical protein NT079_01090, partial [Candidatus Omnitrophica bacterium]|nr:hypothetical protein [Candidatus Omnitrophota bacterium]
MKQTIKFNFPKNFFFALLFLFVWAVAVSAQAEISSDETTQKPQPNQAMEAVSNETAEKPQAGEATEALPKEVIEAPQVSETTETVPAKAAEKPQASEPVDVVQPDNLTLKPRPLTLRDCYALSLKQSEIVAIDAELIKQAEARFLKYLGAILPQVSFSWAQTNQSSAFSPLGKNSSDQSQ